MVGFHSTFYIIYCRTEIFLSIRVDFLLCETGIKQFPFLSKKWLQHIEILFQNTKNRTLPRQDAAKF